MNRILLFCSLIVVGLTGWSNLAQAQAVSPPVALQGYSVVSYFTEGEPELGFPEYSVDYDGKRYWFTSEAQRTVFAKNPDHFLPRHQFCSYSLTLGKERPIDPTNFKVVGGTLLLFHKSDEADGLAKWNASRLTEEELLNRADKRYTLLTF